MKKGKYSKHFKIAGVIAKYLGKKLSKPWFVIPYFSVYNSRPTFSLISQDGEEILLGVSRSNLGAFDRIDFKSDFTDKRSNFSLSSENFSISTLLPEFVRLKLDQNYLSGINENFAVSSEQFNGTMINEALRRMTASDKEDVKRLLGEGMSALAISKELQVNYTDINKFKKGELMLEEPGEVERLNEATLDDRVKYLDEQMTDIRNLAFLIARNQGVNSLMITGRAGVGKTYEVEEAFRMAKLEEGDDFFVFRGANSIFEVYKKMFQFNGKPIVFDDSDSIFKDPDGRNLLKGALDTKPVRKISYIKKIKQLYDPIEIEDPALEEELIESGQIPNQFDFYGRVIFISNLKREKADPDGAIISRSLIIDVNPDDATVMERMRRLLDILEPKEMEIEKKEEVFDFLKSAKNVTMRTFVKAAGIRQSGVPNWKRIVSRYL